MDAFNPIPDYFDDIFEESTSACEEDEFEYGDSWQMANFMKAIGYPYEWE